MNIFPEPESGWRPSATWEVLQFRARMLERIRAFFLARGVLEVETPILSHAATTDARLASLATRYTGPGSARGRTLYLHTSPEFPMKRLLAAGSGDIYQVARVFRDHESGRLHNPEFTLLEWYRLGWDHMRLMDEVADLVTEALHDRRDLGVTERLSFRDAFTHYVGVDPHAGDAAALREAARAHGIDVNEFALDDLDAWRDLLLTHLVEPHLGGDRLTFVYDYPASQAALARVRSGIPPLASRFELYLDGVELANGFHELGDAGEQRRRFEHDLAERQRRRLNVTPIDERMLAALAQGLPDCAGVALGVDRLVMSALRTRSINDVLAFPIGCA